MKILDFTDDLLIYILSFSTNHFNLLLTCKRIYKLSSGKIEKNRRGWLSYNISTNMYRKSLHNSIYLNKSNLFNKLIYDIYNFANIDLRHFHEDTINNCIIYDRLDFLKILVEKYDLDPSYPKSIYFLKSCKFGKLEIVKYLSNIPNININVKDVLGCSALVIAAEKGHFEIVKFLSMHSDLHLYDAVEYATFIANFNKHYEIAEYLSTFLSYSP